MKENNITEMESLNTSTSIKQEDDALNIDKSETNNDNEVLDTVTQMVAVKLWEQRMQAQGVVAGKDAPYFHEMPDDTKGYWYAEADEIIDVFNKAIMAELEANKSAIRLDPSIY